MTVPSPYVTGPTSSMPGAVFDLPASEAGARCSTCNNPAEVLLQGETDSMGSERNPVCKPCLVKEKALANVGSCDWCHTRHVRLSSIRDYDEGMSGPVYFVCGSCRKRNDEALAAEPDFGDDDY